MAVRADCAVRPAFVGCAGLVPFVAALALAACAPEPGGEPLLARSALATPDVGWLAFGDATRGHALAERYQCNRCHEAPSLAEPTQKQRCFGCHDDLMTGRLEAPSEVLDSFVPHIADLRRAPSLEGAGRLLRPEWLVAFLQAPHDLRPSMVATMPRLAIGQREAIDLAAWLSGGARDEPSRDTSAGDVERGRQAYLARGCASCHAFGGAGVPEPAVLPRGAARREHDAPAIELAPDLRHARVRLRPDRVAAWIREPASIRPATLMPTLGVTDAEAADLAAFVLGAPLAEPEPAPPRPRLPLLERPVGFAEVEQRVFRRSCWHCHSQPAYGAGDGGPGNTGGFGFAGKRIDLSSYEAISGGYVGDDGQRASLFARAPAGEAPLLVAAMLARTEELEGLAGPVRGMPLGLPPLEPEQIQLVESWIAQGRPR